MLVLGLRAGFRPHAWTSGGGVSCYQFSAGVLFELSTAAKQPRKTADSSCDEQHAPKCTSQGLPGWDGTDRHVHDAVQRFTPLGAEWHEIVPRPNNMSACEQEAALDLAGMLQTELC